MRTGTARAVAYKERSIGIDCRDYKGIQTREITSINIKGNY
jgi:hypothetical protein